MNTPDVSHTHRRATDRNRVWVISVGSGHVLQSQGSCEQRIRQQFPADTLIHTCNGNHLTDWAPALPATGVAIIVGGDGAWREALLGAPEQVRPGFLPAGTVGQAAIELNASASVKAWRSWRYEHIQLGHLHTSDSADASRNVFFLMAGVGVESDAVSLVRPGLKRRIGKWAYVWALLERLLQPVRRTVVIGMDGQFFRTSQVLIQNGAHYGGRYRVADTNVRNPGYRVLIWKYPGRFMWCLTMMCLMFGLPSGWLAHQLPGERLRIRSKVKKQCQVDGDVGPALPLRVTPTTSREIAIADG